MVFLLSSGRQWSLASFKERRKHMTIITWYGENHQWGGTYEVRHQIRCLWELGPTASVVFAMFQACFASILRSLACTAGKSHICKHLQGLHNWTAPTATLDSKPIGSIYLVALHRFETFPWVQQSEAGSAHPIALWWKRVTKGVGEVPIFVARLNIWKIPCESMVSLGKWSVIYQWWDFPYSLEQCS